MKSSYFKLYGVLGILGHCAVQPFLWHSWKQTKISNSTATRSSNHDLQSQRRQPPCLFYLSVITCTCAFSSVHFKVVSRHWEKPTCTPPCVSEVFPSIAFETNQVTVWLETRPFLIPFLWNQSGDGLTGNTALSRPVSFSSVRNICAFLHFLSGGHLQSGLHPAAKVASIQQPKRPASSSQSGLHPPAKAASIQQPKRPPSTSQVSCFTLLSNNASNKPGTILNHTHKELLF